jgi:hypothetical protein
VAGLAEKIPGWFASAVTRYLAPEIIRIVNERVTRSESSLKELMNARFGAIEDTMDARFKAVDDRFKALDDTMNARFATLDAKIDGLELVQRVALLEAKVREMETKR